VCYAARRDNICDATKCIFILVEECVLALTYRHATVLYELLKERSILPSFLMFANLIVEYPTDK
jgi:hypothetical protein